MRDHNRKPGLGPGFNEEERIRNFNGGMPTYCRATGLIGASLLAVAAAGLATPALAQDVDPVTDETAAPPAADDSLAVIVVTASKRESNIMDEPFSITAISGDDLAETGATEYRDYLTAVPGVSLMEAGLGTNNVIIRGLATTAGGSKLSGTVVSYFDEVALNSGIRSVEVEPVDIERVEVLRGPQGTYYGAGSIGGTLRILPNRPDLDDAMLKVSLSGSTTKGANALDSNLSATANLPLVTDAVAIRGSIYRREEVDYIKNLQTGDKVGGGRIEGGRIALKIAPTDNLDMLFQYVREHTRADGQRVREPFEDAGNAVRRRGDEGEKQDLSLYSGSIGYDFGSVRFDAITSYWKSELTNRLDSSLYDGNVIALAGPPSNYGLTAYDLYSDDDAKYDVFAQEVRLTSQTDSWLQWIVGGYYSKEKLDRTSTFVEDQLLGTILVIDQASDTKQLAAFGEFNIDLPGDFGLDLGLRYSDYEKDSTVDADSGTQKEHVWTPRFNLRYEPGDQLVYFQISKGFRLGGFNGPPPAFVTGIPDVEQYYNYKSDKLWNYELGTKLVLADGKVNVSGAVFYSDWTDIPVYLTLAGGAYNPLANIGKATSKGAELELAWRATPDLTLSASGSYTDSKLEGSADYQAQRLPASPREMFNLAFSYDRPVSDTLDIYASGNANYVGSYKTSLIEEFSENIAANQLDTRYGLTTQPDAGGYMLVNLAFGVRLSNGTDISIFAKNLFNNEATTLFNSFSYAGAPAESFLRPRTIGLSLKQEL